MLSTVSHCFTLSTATTFPAQVVEEFELPQLTKLQTNIPKSEDIQWCGFLEQYDEQYDRISTRTERRLQVTRLGHACVHRQVC